MTRPISPNSLATKQTAELLPPSVRQQVASIVVAALAAGTLAACGGGGGGGGAADPSPSSNLVPAAQTVVNPEPVGSAAGSTTDTTVANNTVQNAPGGTTTTTTTSTPDTTTSTGTTTTTTPPDTTTSSGSTGGTTTTTTTSSGDLLQAQGVKAASGSGTSGTTTTTTTTTSTTTTVDPGPYWSQVSGSLVAGFDVASTDAVANWTFYNGSEFPGATGSLAESTGPSGKAAKLSYDFSCGTPWTALAGRQCGRYVAMNLFKVPTSVPMLSTDAPTIAFDVRNLAATALPGLRVVDNTGQTLQFKISARPLENPTGANWQRVQIPVGSSASFWGGANDGVLHLPIKTVTVMAGDPALPVPAGHIEVDNLTYLNSSDTAFDLKANAPLSSTTFPSTYVGRIGVAWHISSGLAAVDKAVAAGINLVRVDLNWQAVEVNGQFDFTYYSNIATELAKRNVKVLWILDYGHKDHGGTAPLSTADQAAYAEFARRTALAFKGRNVVGYEVWNEPNMAAFWPTPDPVAFASLVGVTADAIRTADANAVIVTGGLADLDYEYMIKMLRTGKLSKVNAIGLHPYRKTAPETYAGQLATLNQMVKSVGLTAAIWDTESGFSAYGDVGDVATVGNGQDARAIRRQAILNLRKVLTHITINTPISILYDLANDGTNAYNREHNFGLLNYDLSDKPSIVGLRTLFASQNGRTFKGFLPNVPPGLHALRWDGASDKSFTIWSDAQGNARTKVTLPANATKVVMWDGTVPTTLTATSPKSFYIKESDGPVFVTVPN